MMEMNINGVLIKELRLQKSWSQEKLAESAGLSLRTVQRIESDGVGSLQTRIAISAALGVEPFELDLKKDSSEHQEHVAQNYLTLWEAYLRPGLRIGTIVIAWGGIALTAFLIFVILVGGIFYWEATPFTFWQSVGSALIGASIFVPVLICFYYLYRYLTRSRSLE